MSDSFNFGYRPRPIRLFEGQLHLDPQIEAMMRELDARAAAGRILAEMQRPNWSLALPTFQFMASRPNPLAMPLPAPPPAPAPNPGPATPRPGQLSDVTGAIYQLPAVQRLVGQAHDEGFRRLRELRGEWGNAATPERVIMVTMGTLVVGGMIAPIIANQGPRDFAFGLIKGHDIPVPGVDGLSFRLLDRGGGLTVPLGVTGLSASGQMQFPNSSAPSYNFNVSFDVAAFVRSRR